MVIITNGTVTTKVSVGAYNSMYKDIGFTVVDGEVAASAEEVVVSEPVDEVPDIVDESTQSVDETNDFSELLEKPLTQWSKQEVKDFAAAKGIELQGAKSFNDAKELVKQYLDNEVKNS